MEATLIVNPAFKPETPDEKKAFEQAKAAGPIERIYLSVAMDNIRMSRGMYMLQPAVAPVVTSTAIRMPEEMSADELKLTALQLGVDVKKGMKKADLIKSVRLAMDAVQLIEDDEDDAA